MGSTSGIEHSRVRRIHNERVFSDGSYTSRAENGEVLADFDVNGRGKERIRKLEYYDDEYRSFSQGLVHNRIQGDYCDLNMNRPEYVHFESEQGRFDNFPYHGEGPSSYEMSPRYEYVERTRYRNRDSNMFARAGNLGHDPVELIRKLDELKDQLSQSCNMADKHKERMVSLTPPDPYCLHHNVYVQEGLTSSHGVERQSFASDDLEAPYLSCIHGYTPCTGRCVSGLGDSYPSRDFPHEFKGYSDTDQRKMLRRPPWQPPSHYMHQLYHDDFPGYSRDINHDLFMLSPHTNYFHQPSCSCVSCHSRNLYTPPKIEPYRFPHEPYNSKFHHHLNPILHVPQGYSSGDSNLKKLHSRQSPTLNSSDLSNESDGLNYHHARKLVVAHRNRLVCHPIARGAPFITCCNCFELLKLPRKHVSSTKIQKMKCGACFSVILFELGNEGYTISVSAQVDPVLNEIDNGSSETINENTRDCHGDSHDADMKTCSNNYDDSKIESSPVDSKSNSGESEEQLDGLSSTSSISKDEHSTRDYHGDSHDADMKTCSNNYDDSKIKSSPVDSKSNSGKSEEQLDGLSSTLSISKDEHSTRDYHGDSHDADMKTCSNNYDDSKIKSSPVDSKSNSGESEEQLDGLSSTSSISKDEHSTRDYHGDSHDADMKTCSNNYDDSKIKSSPVDSKSNSGKSEEQLDGLSSTLSISKDEHSTRDYHGDSHDADMKTCSNNYDDSKIKSSPVDSKSNSGESEEQLDGLSSTSSISKDEHSTRDYHGDSHDADMKTCSNNYDDSKIKSSPVDSKSNSGESGEQLDGLSSTSSISKDEHSLDNVTSQIHCSSSAELPLTMVKTFPRSDCSQECPDHCSDDNTVSQFDEGNTSQLSEPALDRTTSLLVPINDAAMATDIDESVNVFSNSCMSQDSVEISREDHQRIIEGAQSFYDGLKKKIFQDFSESNQSSEVDDSKVFVNGHFIPDRDVKKAEKLAGSIQPGEYWYDIIAGFWGVMGHPCLGIIMPNIEEFNYPIPQKCAAGNTGVFVNGRELHQKDLDILASRGLPILKNRYYIVEISGKVIDGQTGEELDGLGKLAPTVQREKHGFGMRVP